MRRALIVLGLTFAFAAPSAAHADDDTAAPVVVSASLSPTAVDVSESSQQVQATLRVTDATGVKAVAGTLKSVDANRETPRAFGVGIAGNKNDGFWRIKFTLPQGTAPGDWRLTYLTQDDAGNQGSSASVPVESLPTVAVTSVEDPDDEGPELVSTAMSPTSVEVGPSAQDVTATFHVTDETGTAHVISSLRSLEADDQATPNQQATLVSGTPQDGQWQTTFTIPRGAAAGTWQVRVLAMDDTLGIVSSGLFLPAEKLATVEVSSSHAPSQVTDVHATPLDGHATVSWTAAADNGAPVTGYEVTSTPGDLTKSVAGDQTSVDFDGLTNGTSYTFTVIATNAGGPSPVSAPSNAVTPNPAFETGPTASITGDTQAGETLTAHEGTPSPTPDSYTYQWSAGGVPIEDATAATFELTSAEVGKSVTVRVTAVKAGYVDASDVSDPVTVGAPLEVAAAKSVVPGGSTVRVTTTGLAKRESYTITIGGVLVKSATATYGGAVSAYVRVPSSLPDGPVDVVVAAASGRHGSTSIYNALAKTFDVTPGAESVPRNGTTTITVTGMAPGEKVRVTFSGRAVSPRTAVADENGSYTQSFSVGTRTGDRPLKVTGLSYKRTGTSSVTVTP